MEEGVEQFDARAATTPAPGPSPQGGGERWSLWLRKTSQISPPYTRIGIKT
jgi:hypothetical protein